jgi:CHAD domain-containing protein
MGTGAETEDLRFCRSVLESKWAALLPELSAVKSHPSGEAIHNTRVQSRRLRAALEAFQDLCPAEPWRTACETVRAITRTLGGVRETEVLGTLISELDLGADQAAALCREYLQERLEKRTRKLNKRLARELRQIKVKRLQSQIRLLTSSLDGQSAGGLHDRFVRVISALAAPVLEFRARRSFSRASDQRLHRLRIAVKKLRYGLELFDEILPGELQAVIEQARAMQDAAGSHQVWSVLREFLQREIRRLTAQKTTNLAFQTGRILRIVEDRKRELRQALLPTIIAVQAGVQRLLSPELAPLNGDRPASPLRT